MDRCPPGSHTAKYSCPSAGSVTVKYVCGASSPASPTCPSHYDFKNGKCVWDGSGTAGTSCPAGLQYNSSQMCCMSTAGTGTNFCPAGLLEQDLGNGQFVCVKNGALGAPQSSNISVGNPPSAAQCSSGGGNCQVQTCGYKEQFCKSKCSCISMFSSCP